MVLDILRELSLWRDAAAKIYNKWDKEYDACLERNNADILSVKRDHSTLPEHYWHPLHKAFVRRETARQLLEIIRELEKEVKIEQEEIRKASTGAGINMKHENINTGGGEHQEVLDALKDC